MHGGVIIAGDGVGIVNGAGLELHPSIIEDTNVTARSFNIADNFLRDGDGFCFAFVISVRSALVRSAT